jgi:hypothetical protein
MRAPSVFSLASGLAPSLRLLSYSHSLATLISCLSAHSCCAIFRSLLALGLLFISLLLSAYVPIVKHVHLPRRSTLVPVLYFLLATLASGYSGLAFLQPSDWGTTLTEMPYSSRVEGPRSPSSSESGRTIQSFLTSFAFGTPEGLRNETVTRQGWGPQSVRNLNKGLKSGDGMGRSRS